MAKVGTAILEIKPILNEEALAALSAVIETAVETAVTRAMSKSVRKFGTGVDAETLHHVQERARQDHAAAAGGASRA